MAAGSSTKFIIMCLPITDANTRSPAPSAASALVVAVPGQGRE